MNCFCSALLLFLPHANLLNLFESNKSICSFFQTNKFIIGLNVVTKPTFLGTKIFVILKPVIVKPGGVTETDRTRQNRESQLMLTDCSCRKHECLLSKRSIRFMFCCIFLLRPIFQSVQTWNKTPPLPLHLILVSTLSHVWPTAEEHSGTWTTRVFAISCSEAYPVWGLASNWLCFAHPTSLTALAKRSKEESHLKYERKAWECWLRESTEGVTIKFLSNNPAGRLSLTLFLCLVHWVPASALNSLSSLYSSAWGLCMFRKKTCPAEAAQTI